MQSTYNAINHQKCAQWLRPIKVFEPVGAQCAEYRDNYNQFANSPYYTLADLMLR